MSLSTDIAPRTSMSARSAYTEPRLSELTQREFQLLTQLIHAESGISLVETKRALVVRRLSGRIVELGLTSFGEYYDFVCADESGAELVRMLDMIATNETHFFREPAHFELLERRVFPAWRSDAEAGRRSRTIRVWSAACSTGQEPYSIAMQLLTTFPPSEGWSIDILATDISTQALHRAEMATWSVDKAKEIPERYLKRFMLRGVGECIDLMRATPELRETIRFSRLNLNDASYDVGGTFDLVFCRNVMIYFTSDTRAAVIERLTDRLSAGGLLFVGHAESLHAHRTRLVSVIPTVYSRAQ